jgi:hypothetical protein
MADKWDAASVGDVVRYCGSLTEYTGTVWEVTCKDARGLILFDVDRALWNVQQESVVVVGRKKRQRRKAPGKVTP